MEMVKATKYYEVNRICEYGHCDDPDAECDGCKKYVINTWTFSDLEFLDKELAEAKLRELKGEN